MHHDDHATERTDSFRPAMHRMETYERPVARTPLRPLHGSHHAPDGDGCAGIDPAYRGL
ncbi:hypothetical protein [Streptomyces sp. cmx-4-9]|uniref:hypothetical protein n=1 Tax=Streptomyces sp. cmx-4-9 TaxID=2790941 RepID=UPI00397EDD1E